MKVSTMVEIISKLEKIDDFISDGYNNRNRNQTWSFSEAEIKELKDELRIVINMIKDIEL